MGGRPEKYFKILIVRDGARCCLQRSAEHRHLRHREALNIRRLHRHAELNTHRRRGSELNIRHRHDWDLNIHRYSERNVGHYIHRFRNSHEEDPGSMDGA